MKLCGVLSDYDVWGSLMVFFQGEGDIKKERKKGKRLIKNMKKLSRSKSGTK
jgi:hypothetical protein